MHITNTLFGENAEYHNVNFYAVCDEVTVLAKWCNMFHCIPDRSCTKNWKRAFLQRFCTKWN